MAYLTDPVGMRDQLYDFLSSHATLTEIETWSKSLLDIIPEEVESAGKAFPICAVTWTYEFNAQETQAYYIGGGDATDRILWACVSTRSTVDNQTAVDQAVKLADLIQLALRSTDGRRLAYGGNYAAENVQTPETRIRVARKTLDQDNWYATVYVKIMPRIHRGKIS